MKFDKNKKPNKKLTIIFCVIMAMAILNTVSRQSRGNKTKKEPGSFEDAVSVEPAGAAKKFKRSISTLNVHESWGIDPFTSIEERRKHPESSEDNDAPVFRLTGILNDGVRARAVINGQVYTTGSSLTGYMIEYISSESVRLRKGTRVLLLTL